MALDWQKMSWAGNAPIGSLNVGGNNRSNVTGNPFAANSQEFQEYEQKYTSLPQSQGGAIPDAEYQAKRFMELNKEANAPVVESLRASLPEQNAKYESTKTQLTGRGSVLDQKYDALLQQINDREQTEKTTATTNLSREYGKRGVAGGAYDLALEQTVNPINRFYGGQNADVLANRADSQQGLNELLASLTNSSVEEQRAVLNAIAQLEAGGNQQGILQGIQQAQQNFNNTQQGFENSIVSQKLPFELTYADLVNKLQNQKFEQTGQTNPIDLALLALKNTAAQQEYKTTSGFDWAKYGLG